MRRLAIVPLVVALLLTGACGDDPADEAGPADRAAQSPSAPYLDQIIALAGVGGEVSERAVLLDDRAAVREFTRQFEDPEDVAQQLTAPVRQAEDEGTLLAVALVSIDCDVPQGVKISETDKGLKVVAEPIPDTGKQCLAPLSSIAVIVVPE